MESICADFVELSLNVVVDTESRETSSFRLSCIQHLIEINLTLLPFFSSRRKLHRLVSHIIFFTFFSLENGFEFNAKKQQNAIQQHRQRTTSIERKRKLLITTKKFFSTEQNHHDMKLLEL
jgi:uncharacterized membrane protein